MIKGEVKRIRGEMKLGVQKLSAFEQQIRRNNATPMLAALALVIAFMWRDAIQEIVSNILSYFNITGTTWQYRVIAAVFTTIICTIGILYFSRWSEKKEK